MQNTKDKWEINKIQIGTTTTNSNGDLQKEYCTISNTLRAVVQTKGSLYINTSHIIHTKIYCKVQQKMILYTFM